MDLKNVAIVVTGLVVAVLMLTIVLMPIVSTATEETLTYENTGTTYAEYDGESEISIVLVRDSAGDVTITTNGETCETPDFSLYSAATLVYGSDGFVRMLKGTGSNDNLHIFTSTSTYLGVAVGETVTITVTSTGATMVKDNITKSGTFTPTAYIAAEGDYVLAANPCVTEDSEIILAGVTNVSSGNAFSLIASGTIDNLTVDTPYITSSDSLTVSSVATTVNTSDCGGNLVKIDSIVFNLTMSDDTVWTGTYTYFLAPSEVVYDNPSYAGDTEAALLDIVPLLITVGIIIGIVGMAFSRRE